MATMLERKCETCGAGIYARLADINRGKGKFCSVACSAARFKTKAEYSCERCSKPFEAFKYARDAGHGRFCSRKCHYRSSTKAREVPCENCGATCTVLPSNKSTNHFCSHACHRAKVGSKSLKERFLERCGEVDADGCIPWMGNLNSAGYGLVGMGASQRAMRAHRVAYQLFKGPVASGVVVMHRCDNPRCVNADHLQLGTHSDNHADMVSKLRHNHGERSYFAKLTEEQVREIRRRSKGTSQGDLAESYGVSRQTIARIISRETWKYVT